MAISQKIYLKYSYKNKEYLINKECLVTAIDALGLVHDEDDNTLLRICEEHYVFDDIFLKNINNLYTIAP